MATDRIDFPIDLVYTWVDGNDSEWRKRHDEIAGITGRDNDCKGRYSDNDELKYSLRSIEKYAPWINKIYIVTDNQIPAWLDTSNPKIRIVDHTEIMPPESLPCFNSQIIEHCIANIPSLSEHFIYANDDMFINRPALPSDFFDTDGYPIIRMNRRPLRKVSQFLKVYILRKPLNSYLKAIRNAAELVKSRYGKYYGCKTHHNIDAYCKSECLHVREVFRKEIDRTMTNHLRSDNDIQRIIYSYVPLAEKEGHLKYVGHETSCRLQIHRPRYHRVLKQNPMFFCVNDSEHAQDAHRAMAKEFLEMRFPEKSQFEK